MTHEVLVAEHPAATVSPVDSSTSVDTALTDVVVQTAETTTTVGVSPYTIIDQSGGAGALDDHLNDVAAAHAASAISFSPTGTISATDLQAAVAEVASEAGATALQLAANTSAGATSITVNSVPAQVVLGCDLLIDAMTNEGEIRIVTAIAGTTLSFSSPLRWAHSSGNAVFVLSSDVILTEWFGCRHNGSTDDWLALQRAMNAAGGLYWLNGQGGTHMISQPLVEGPSHHLRAITIKALTSFAPADTTNAMIINQQGNITDITADPATDIITCSAAHGSPADNLFVLFQGTSLPAPLVSGRMYYTRDRTATTLKVAATSGGAAIDITTAGSGEMRMYSEMYSPQKSQMEDVYVHGNSVVGLNGVKMCLQQQGYWDKVRVDRCDGYGVLLGGGGQQHVMYNFETIICRVGLLLDNMSFVYCYGFNAEGCDKGVHVGTDGAHECAFWGIHIEMNLSTYTTTASIAFDMDGSARNMVFDNVEVSFNAAGPTCFKVDTGGALNSSYTIRNVKVNGPATTGMFMLNDVDRGTVLDVWDDCRQTMVEMSAAQKPTADSYTDPYPNIHLRPAGGYVSWGAQIHTSPSFHTRPGTTQTSDQILIRDSSGNRTSGFNKAGVLFTERNSAPADADLVAGELTFWLDDTNGACKVKFKAKQADGTVRNGEVALA